MRATIIENVLSDGSKTYDVQVINGVGEEIQFPAADEREAQAVQELMEQLTCDFLVYQTTLGARQ